MSRRALASTFALALLASGCVTARPRGNLPPQGEHPTAEAAVELETGSDETGPRPAPPVQTAPAAPPPGQGPPPTLAPPPPWLIGAWAWEDDVVVFSGDGTGVYYRGGDPCFTFGYFVEQEVLAIRAREDSGCQGRRDNDYRLLLRGGRMVWTHIGSSYQTTWDRAQPPLEPGQI